MMRHYLILFLVLTTSAFCETCKITLSRTDAVIAFSFSLPQGNLIYRDSLALTQNGKPLPFSVQGKTQIENGIEVYTRDFTMLCPIETLNLQEANITLGYQECEPAICHLPQWVTYSLEHLLAIQKQEEAVSFSLDNQKEIARCEGYSSPREFLNWLQTAEAAPAASPHYLEKIWHNQGLLWVVLVLIPLGFLLNFTPCILPMIPINLAIIGASQTAQSRFHSILRALLYGSGMALAYGTLGVVTILTGSRFGAITRSPWFSAVIAVIFVVLGLSLWDLFHIDFSRFRNYQKITGGLSVFVLGGVTALLSGACVAPVLIWTLLFSATLYAQGNGIALVLPFVLGIGMALPWPLLGAGFSILPRPGRWMRYINRCFAVVIIGFAGYYGVQAIRLWGGQANHHKEGWLTSLPEALEAAQRSQKEILLEFSGNNCKACSLMQKSTLQNPQVKEVLQQFILCEINADENPGWVKQMKIQGIPTYILLK